MHILKSNEYGPVYPMEFQHRDCFPVNGQNTKTCHCAEAISYTTQYQDLIRTSLEADLKARISNLQSLPIHFLSFNSYKTLLLGVPIRADVGICLDVDLVHLNHHAAELVRGWTAHTAGVGQN